jgi:hypothetical protein
MTTTEIAECFACSRSYLSGDGRFCSVKCRTAFDDGFQPHERTAARYSLPISGDGFMIPCVGCGKPFSSLGLRACSKECERQYLDRKDTLAVLAEVGIEVSAKRKCTECGGDIPRYVGVGKKRRLVNSTRLTCSPKCQRKAAKEIRSQTAA